MHLRQSTRHNLILEPLKHKRKNFFKKTSMRAQEILFIKNVTVHTVVAEAGLMSL